MFSTAQKRVAQRTNILPMLKLINSVFNSRKFPNRMMRPAGIITGEIFSLRWKNAIIAMNTNMLLWMNAPDGPVLRASPSKNRMKGIPPPMTPTVNSLSHCFLFRFLMQIGSLLCFLNWVMDTINKNNITVTIPFFANV